MSKELLGESFVEDVVWGITHAVHLPGEVVEAQLEREGVEPSGEGDSQAHEVERSATRSMSGTIGGLRLRTRGARKSSLGRSFVCSLRLQKPFPVALSLGPKRAPEGVSPRSVRVCEGL